MITVRYTVDGYGIFAAMKRLYEADADAAMDPVDYSDLEAIEDKFDRELELPDICRDSAEREKYRSYFTKEGLDHFSREIDRLLSLYRTYVGNPDVEYKRVSSSDMIAYQDAFQVLIPA